MNKLIFIILAFMPLALLAQVEWVDINTPVEKLTGVIHTEDSSFSDKQIYDAIIAALPLMQADRVNNKKTDNQQILNAVAGGADNNGNTQVFSGFQTQNTPSLIVFNVQDLHKTTRVYYILQVQIKPGRYKITVTPVGTSGSALMTPNIDWGFAYKKSGEVKGIYKKYLESWRGVMSAFSEELAGKVNASGVGEDW